jgi:hypothetical protein
MQRKKTMTATITLSVILEECKLTKRAAEIKGSESDSQYFHYWVPGERYVHVESTASQLMESVTRFSMDDQCLIFNAIAEQLPEPGDSVIILDDSDAKRRTAYIARLKGPENVVKLLVTR